ncbi:MAG: hypothetical protein ISR34_11925 [Pirellulales bacterium]|nr:hypothetical protein [Pirellulales bacterium]
MLRLRPAFEGCDVTFCTTNGDYESDVEGIRFRKIIDANRTQKLKAILSLVSVAWVVLTEGPDIILSTGAAPGFFAIRLGRLLGKKTIWIDSIANAEELSLSGQKVGKFASLWLTQWEHLAKPEGPHYYGNVLGDAASEEAIANPKSLIADQESSPTQILSNSNDQRSVISDQRSNSSDQRSEISDPVTKIFVTVGSDVPFDRMVIALDQWAANHPECSIFAQVGNSTINPEHIESVPFLTPTEFAERIQQSDLVVGHAGMGTILSALKHGKPVLVMPRFGYLGETRNEHQVATVEHLTPLEIIQVAKNEHTLVDCLATLDALTTTRHIAAWASRGLIETLHRFIHEDERALINRLGTKEQTSPPNIKI